MKNSWHFIIFLGLTFLEKALGANEAKFSQPSKVTLLRSSLASKALDSTTLRSLERDMSSVSRFLRPGKLVVGSTLILLSLRFSVFRSCRNWRLSWGTRSN